MAERNIAEVNLAELIRYIERDMKHEIYSPISVFGKVGIGKTEGIMGVAKKNGWGFKELRLSHYQESDLVGLPYIDPKTGQTKHAPTDLLPDTNDPNPGILLLDEVTSCTAGMRGAVYQLLDASRGLGQYKLPEKWKIVCCGNDEEDGGVFRGIENGFLSRGLSYRLNVQLDVWKQWALANGINSSIIAFLSFSPSKLHDMGDVQVDEAGLIACPRSWAKLSKYMNLLEDEFGGVKNAMRQTRDIELLASGCVGFNAGTMFAQFYQYNKDTISAEDVVNGKQFDPSILSNVKTETLYLTNQGIISLLADKLNAVKNKSDDQRFEAVGKEVGNVFKFFIEMEKLNLAVGVDLAITVFQTLSQSLGDTFSNVALNPKMSAVCPEFDKWIYSHADLLKNY